MTEENTVTLDELVMPALLRHARITYGKAMRDALAQAGYDDIPRNGLYVIGGLAMGSNNVPLGLLVRDLQISKQAVGQLVDSLVLRGYLQRNVDEDDRRKLTITLTERGHAAAGIQAQARARIDAELEAQVGAAIVAQTRKALAALVAMGLERSGD